MFITNEAHRSKLEALISDAGESVWRSAEVCIEKPWFIVSVVQTGSGDTDSIPSDFIEDSALMRRTLLVANLEDLVSFTESLDVDTYTLAEVHVLLPPLSESMNRWQMEPLAAVWGLAESSHAGLPMLGRGVLETTSGAKYWDFPNGTYDGQQKELVLRIRFSNMS
ncbi:MAG: hypothetical protein HYX45_11855 [Burkholderiales bacterium]|nr:hypothetical protein [Burkholderiales bacterium]